MCELCFKDSSELLSLVFGTLTLRTRIDFLRPRAPEHFIVSLVYFLSLSYLICSLPDEPQQLLHISLTSPPLSPLLSLSPPHVKETV